VVFPVIDTLIRWFTETLAWIVRRLSKSTMKRLADCLGWTWYHVIPIRRATARSNLAMALGYDHRQSRTTILAMYRHLALSILELFRYGTPRGEPVPLRVEGQVHLDAAIEQGRGVLVVTAHLGNWEVLLRYGAGLSRPVKIVTRDLSVSLFQKIWAYLRTGGPGLLSASNAASSMVNGLKAGEIIGMVLDQHAPETSAIPVPFFCHPASTSTGLVRASRLLNLPILPMFTWRDGTTHVISIGPNLAVQSTQDRRLDILNATTRCTQAIEAAVRAHPEQWLWIHRRWKVRNKQDLMRDLSE
jgi:KDO2-lipid IV(A) lauroyltransferase